MKRFPALIGVVNALLVPGDTSGVCTAPVDIPADVRSTACVDFLMTSALGPLIPGKEYYIDRTASLTMIEEGNFLFGTALDNITLLMINLQR